MNLVTEPNIPPASFSPVQEFQSYAQLVTELQQRNGPTLEMLQKCCKDNQDKDVKIELVVVIESGLGLCFAMDISLCRML